MPRALARVVGVDTTGFAQWYWGRAPLLCRAADPAAFRDVLDLDGIDELLTCRGLRSPFLRLARDGAVVDSTVFTGPGGVGAEIGDQVCADQVASLFSEGNTIVLQALHRNWPDVMDFVTELAAELGHPAMMSSAARAMACWYPR